MADKPNFTIIPKTKTKKDVKSMHAAHRPAARKKAAETRRRNFLAKKEIEAQRGKHLPAVAGKEISMDQLKDIMAPERTKPGPKPGSIGKGVVKALEREAMDLLGDMAVSIVQAMLNRRR